jgi:hypothetical protein
MPAGKHVYKKNTCVASTATHHRVTVGTLRTRNRVEVHEDQSVKEAEMGNNSMDSRDNS